MAAMDWMEEDDDLQSNFNSLKQKHHLHGFREGMSKGQDYILQSAFNDGFKKSALCLEKLAEYRGIISAIYMYLMNTPQFNEGIGSEFESLIRKMENYENDSKHTEQFQWKSQKEEDETLRDQDKMEQEESQGTDTLVESFGKLEQTNAGRNYLMEDGKQTVVESFGKLKQTNAGNNCQLEDDKSDKHELSKIETGCCSLQEKKTCNCQQEPFVSYDSNLDENFQCVNNLKKNYELVTYVRDKMTEIMSLFDESTRNSILTYVEGLSGPPLIYCNHR